jgi:spore maturation protein CgeB
MNYNLEHYVYMNLVKLGHEVKFYGYRKRIGRLANPIRMAITRSKFMRDAANLLWLSKVNDEIKRVAEAFQPDLVLSIKGEAVKPETIEWVKDELGAITALWYPDDPRFFDSLVKQIAPSYDYVFTCSNNAVSKYKELGIEHVHRIPFACEPTVHKRMNLDNIRMCNVVFIGTYGPLRFKFIKALMRAGVNVRVYGPYWKYFMKSNNVYHELYGPEMVKLFNSSKIVLNFHADRSYGPNMRVFEVTGSGAFLLTDEAEDLRYFFRVGKEIETFDNEKELLYKVNYFLCKDRERNDIASAGYVRCHNDHTYRKRVEQMMNLIK